MNVGFYYMANAVGRLAGTVLSGLLYQWNGLSACLWVSAGFVIAAGLLSLMLPTRRPARTPGIDGHELTADRRAPLRSRAACSPSSSAQPSSLPS